MQLYLFGPPRLERDGEPIDVGLRKAEALLAYLTVTGQPQGRDALAAMFWPEDDQQKARGNLRRALSRVNTALGKGQLDIDRKSVGLGAQTDIWLDIDHFQRRVDECAGHNHPPNEVCPDCMPLLIEAAAIYTDDFLTGFTLPDCPDFDEWQFFQTEGLRQELASVLERLAQNYASHGEYVEAIPYARRWLALDRLHEPAHRQLVELYARAGQHAAALRQYEECVRVLAEELGVPPSKKNTALYEEIRSLKWPDKTSGNGDAAPPHQHNLPPQPTPFLGRENELAALDDLIVNPDARLVTIVGLGGMGKTRLAIQAATESLDAFVDGIHFVPLAPISSDAFLIAAIAEALDIAFYGAADESAQLLNYLRNKQSLLVLDNFEHVLDGAELLSEIASAAPGVKLLVTSRERLNLQQEWTYELRGMAFPLDDDEIPVISETAKTPADLYSAVRLFEQRAQQNRFSFDLTAEYPAVVRICQLVGGMPLGLELAATWVRLMSCQEIALEIARNVDFLATPTRNVPERQRSLRAVFDHSWQLLSDEEKEVCRKLSVFRGGFSREAAEEVAMNRDGSTASLLLSALVDKSMLRRTRSGRYEIHELLRQYAAEKLTEANENDAVQDRHSDYYAGFLHQCEADLKGSRQYEAVAAIAADIDNIRAAWSRAVFQGNHAAIASSLEGLYWYYDISGSSFNEAETAFRQALRAFGGDPASAETIPLTNEQTVLVGQLLGALGAMHFRLSRFVESESLVRQSISLLRGAGPGAERALALALYWLAPTLADKGDYVAGIRNAEEGLKIFAAAGDRFGQGLLLFCLGNVSEFRGDYRRAKSRYQDSIAVLEQIGERRGRLFGANALGRVDQALGAYAEATKHLGTALRARREYGDRFGTSWSLAALGSLSLARGDLIHAKTSFKACQKLSLELNNQVASAWALDGLGTVARLEGAYEEAEALHKESLAIGQMEGRQRDTAICLNNLGRLAFDQGAYEQAEQLYRESLSICQEIDHRSEMASTLRHLGHVSVAMGSDTYPKAQRYYGQALKIASQTRVAPVALDVLVGWATLLMAVATTDAERVQAIEQLALVQRHPASEYETRENARRLLTEWSSTLPAARSEIRSLDLWGTAAKLLEKTTT